MGKTIAAISTPNAAGGIGIVRLSGEESFAIGDKIFRAVSGRTLSSLEGYRAAYGRVFDEKGDIDEAVCLVFRAPKSYTGENVLEISCHGGLYLLQRVLAAAVSAGATPAQAGEFTERAWLNGKLKLDEAEAVMSLIGAQGEQAARAALSALDGALNKKMDGVCSLLCAASASFSAWVDYPDEEIEELKPEALEASLSTARNELNALLDRFEAGMAVTEGVTAAIVGRPNTGKSTLMNLLSGSEKSIVTSVAGTTRDVVEETVRVGNAVLRLCDTAGIHETDDEVESIGVERAVRLIERSQLILAVLDGSQPLCNDDLMLLRKCTGTPCIAIINKTDLPQILKTEPLSSYITRSVTVCAKDGSGIAELEKAVCEVLGTDSFDPSAAMLANQRQRTCVQKAVTAIDEALCALNNGVTLDAVNVCVDTAIDALLELTGKRATQAVADEVFKRFCVGK